MLDVLNVTLSLRHGRPYQQLLSSCFGIPAAREADIPANSRKNIHRKIMPKANDVLIINNNNDNVYGAVFVMTVTARVHPVHLMKAD